MKVVAVFIYGYKNKNLFHIYNELKNKSSNKNIILYYIYDQNNENKDFVYKNLDKVFYNHVFWDNHLGISNHRNKVLNTKFDYFFEVDNVSSIKNNWDDDLINYNKAVIVKKNKNENLSTVFINKTNSYVLKELDKLKYNGEYFYFLYLLYKNNIDYIFFENNFILLNKNTIANSDYIPFSLNHNYNEVLKVIKSDDGFKNFMLKNNIDLNTFNIIQNQNNDVLYKNTIYNIDIFGSEKFKKINKNLYRPGV